MPQLSEDVLPRLSEDVLPVASPLQPFVLLPLQAPEVLSCPDKAAPGENKDKQRLGYNTQVCVSPFLFVCSPQCVALHIFRNEGPHIAPLCPAWTVESRRYSCNLDHGKLPHTLPFLLLPRLRLALLLS